MKSVKVFVCLAGWLTGWPGVEGMGGWCVAMEAVEQSERESLILTAPCRSASV